MPKNKLIDSQNRQINYLRISVTDRCNFRCRYCLSSENPVFFPDTEIFSFDEIMRVVESSLSLGINKFKVTGGEPLIRSGIMGFLSRLVKTPGVDWVSLTTNGSCLQRDAKELVKTGLNSINVSLNSLKEDKFNQINGVPLLKSVWQGIEMLLQSGMKNIKINTVLMRGVNDDEILDFAWLTVDRSISLRFIEYMPCGTWANGDFSWTIPAEEVISRISQLGRFSPTDEKLGKGPAKYYRLDGAAGFIGFITPVSQPFCGTCNRLRLTANGLLKFCLLSKDSIDLKTILRSESLTDEDIANAFRQAAQLKPKVHQSEHLGTMAKIGG